MGSHGLLVSVFFQSAEQMFRPITQTYQQSGGSGDSNTDRSNTTGNLGHSLCHQNLVWRVL